MQSQVPPGYLALPAEERICVMMNAGGLAGGADPDNDASEWWACAAESLGGGQAKYAGTEG